MLWEKSLEVMSETLYIYAGYPPVSCKEGRQEGAEENDEAGDLHILDHALKAVVIANYGDFL